MKAFGEVTATVLLGVIGVVGTIHAMVVLWLWFVVPWLHIQPLNWKAAWGLILLVSLTRASPFKTKEEREQPFSSKIAVSVGVAVSPWIALFLGWIVK